MEIVEQSCDVVVVGGGGAGARAAWECANSGLDVVLAVKGALGRSGCSIFAGNLAWFQPDTQPGDPVVDDQQIRIDRTVEFLAKYTHFLGDQHYFKAAAEFNQKEFYPWLEDHGLWFLRDEHGELLNDLPRRTQAWIVKMGSSGQQVMNLMRQLVLHSEVDVKEHTTATAILTEEGRVAGVTLLDYASGIVEVIRCRSVILATGHNNYLATRSTGTREGAANGWAIGYRAGVPLQDIEVQWYHASDIASPPSWMRLHLYPNPMPNTSQRSKLTGADGVAFFDGNHHMENPVPYIMQMKALIKRVREGAGRFDGSYFTDYRHVEPEVLEKYVAPTAFLKKLGLDPTRDLIESGATWHMNVGGLQVEQTTMASNIGGLFMAGSVTALVTGGLPNVVYDGIVAAQSARDYVSSADWAQLPTDRVAVELGRLAHARRPCPEDGVTAAQVKRLIRSVMWKFCGPIKNEAGLSAGLQALATIREESLPRMGRRSQQKRFDLEWVEAVDVEDMLTVCEMVFQFSLARKESRGSFFREDYPYTDNAEWLVHTVGSPTDDGGQISHTPVELPFVKPEETARADFFALDY